MTLRLYKNVYEKNRLSKYLTRLVTLNGNMRTSLDILNPTIDIQINSDISLQTILSSNYAYIVELGRFYFINDVSIVTNSIVSLMLSVDVLSTYKDSIKELFAYVGRNKNTYNPFLIDNKVNYESEKEISYLTYLNLSSVTTFTSLTPYTVDYKNAIISYLTDDTIYFSSSTPSYEDLEGINIYANGHNMSTQYMVSNVGLLYDLSKAVYKDDTMLSFIKNIKIYPYDIDSVEVAGKTTIKIGDDSFALTQPFNYPLHSLDRVTIAHFNMPSAESFLDYSPFTRYEIYVPYCEFVELSGESILGKTLKVFYLVNYDDGSATAYIYNVTDDKILYSKSCVLGVNVSLSSSNARELNDSKNALALNTSVNLLGSAISIIGGVVTENPVAVMGGVLKATGTIGSAITSYNQMYDIGKVNISSGNEGLSNFQKVFIKKTKVKPVDYDSNFAHQFGLPLNEYAQLSSLSGYTEISDIHLKDIHNDNIYATENEIDMIDSLLKQGVIL